MIDPAPKRLRTSDDGSAVCQMPGTSAPEASLPLTTSTPDRLWQVQPIELEKYEDFYDIVVQLCHRRLYPEMTDLLIKAATRHPEIGADVETLLRNTTACPPAPPAPVQRPYPQQQQMHPYPQQDDLVPTQQPIYSHPQRPAQSFGPAVGRPAPHPGLVYQSHNYGASAGCPLQHPYLQQNHIPPPQQPTYSYPQQPVQAFGPALGPPAPHPDIVYHSLDDATAAGNATMPSASQLRILQHSYIGQSLALDDMQAYLDQRRAEVTSLKDQVMRQEMSATAAELSALQRDFSSKRKRTPSLSSSSSASDEMDFTALVDNAEVALGHHGRFDRMSSSREESVAMDVEHELGQVSSNILEAMAETGATWTTKKNAVTAISKLLMAILQGPIGPCKKHNTNFHGDLADNFLESVEGLNLEERKLLAVDAEWMGELDALYLEAKDNSCEDTMNVEAVKDILQACLPKDTRKKDDNLK